MQDKDNKNGYTYAITGFLLGSSSDIPITVHASHLLSGYVALVERGNDPLNDKMQVHLNDKCFKAVGNYEELRQAFDKFCRLYSWKPENHLDISEMTEAGTRKPAVRKRII